MSRRPSRLPLLTGLLLAAGPVAVPAQTLPSAPAVSWVSGAFPPFSFVGPNGPRGIAIDLMRASLARADLPEASPAFMPWSRVLALLGSGQPVCASAMTRTAAREPLYQWVGPFVPADVSVARLAAATAAPALSASRVVVIRGDVAESAARQLGVVEARIARASDPETAARMLLHGRVDAWVHGDAAMRWTLASMGHALETVSFSASVRVGDNYFACNRAVPADYLARLQGGLDALKKPPRNGSSEYERILSRYLGGPQGTPLPR
jgi:polar amino acid transport system substrate-binding protein